jgi:hypothetical protein
VDAYPLLEVVLETAVQEVAWCGDATATYVVGAARGRWMGPLADLVIGGGAAGCGRWLR